MVVAFLAQALAVLQFKKGAPWALRRLLVGMNVWAMLYGVQSDHNSSPNIAVSLPLLQCAVHAVCCLRLPAVL